MMSGNEQSSAWYAMDEHPVMDLASAKQRMSEEVLQGTVAIPAETQQSAAWLVLGPL